MNDPPPADPAHPSSAPPRARSGAEFGRNLLRNQPGRSPGAARARGAGGPELGPRHRYLLPGGEVFDLDLDAVPPVLGARSDRDGDR